MNCEMCKQQVEQDEIYVHYGKKLCEDCYITILHRPKGCGEPMAVSSAKRERELKGYRGAEGLTPIQKKLYNFVKEKGKIEKDELFETLDIPPWEIETQFAVLRRCELLKAYKVDKKIYITTFDN